MIQKNIFFLYPRGLSCTLCGVHVPHFGCAKRLFENYLLHIFSSFPNLGSCNFQKVKYDILLYITNLLWVYIFSEVFLLSICDIHKNNCVIVCTFL